MAVGGKQMHCSRKRIAIFVSSLSSGGAQRAAANLGNEFLRQGDDILIITLKDQADYEYSGPVRCLGGDIPKKNLPVRIAKSIIAARRLSRVCRKEGLEQVVAFGEICGLVVFLAKYLFGAPRHYIFSIRNNPWACITSRLYLQMLRVISRNAKCVVSVSSHLAEMLKNKMGLTNVEAIPNGIDVERCKREAAETLPEADAELMTDGRYTFINVGSLSEQKNQCALIHAFAKLTDDLRNKSKLVILGDGPLEPALSDIIRNHDLQDAVYLLGRKKNVFPYLQAADCFFLSSMWEGFPNVLLEALALGLFVISTDCETGPRELIAPEVLGDEKMEYPFRSDGGLLVPTPGRPPLDANSSNDLLSEAMRRVVRDAAKGPAVSRDSKVPDRHRLHRIAYDWKRCLRAMDINGTDDTVGT